MKNCVLYDEFKSQWWMKRDLTLELYAWLVVLEKWIMFGYWTLVANDLDELIVRFFIENMDLIWVFANEIWVLNILVLVLK